MAARDVRNLIMRLYQVAAEQTNLVRSMEESIEFSRQANDIVDVTHLTGTTMQEETKHLDTVRSVLDDLYSRLGDAIESWSRLDPSERAREQLPWAQFPGHPPEEPLVEQSSPKFLGNNSKTHVPTIADPAIGTHARYEQQWKSWMNSPKVHNTHWWMQEQDHYGLLQPREQGQLESAARAAQFYRAHAPPAPARHHQPFPQELRYAQQQQQHAPAAGPCALPVSPPPASEMGMSNHRVARTCSEDFGYDEDYDPEFWSKILPPGNLWTNTPQARRCLEEECFSPSHPVRDRCR